MDEEGSERTKTERISRANQRLGRLGSIARCRANKYEVVRGIWKGMAVPSVMYGLESMTWSTKDKSKNGSGAQRSGQISFGCK